MRNTTQKEQVRAALAKRDHPTADEVYERVRRKVPAVSRATVYRILNKMADSGSVMRVKLPDFANRYDCRTEPHYHAQCLRCGRVFDVGLSAPPRVDCSGVRACGADIVGYNLIFEAICADCGGKE